MADEKDILFTSGSTVPKNTVKKIRTYGATSKSASTTSQKTRLHKVRPSDTLVSLAIKYETTVEELKRLNGLWSNDGLQLKSSIKVPELSGPAAGSRSGSASGTSSRNPTPPSTVVEAEVSFEQFVADDEAPAQPAAAANSSAKPNHSMKSASSSSVTRSKTFASDRDFSEMDSNEFLRKFDLKFMQLKTNVEKLENESSLSEEDTQAAYSCMPARRTARYLHSQQARRQHGSGAPTLTTVADPGLADCSPADALANPELVVRSKQLVSANDVEETFYKL
ncbi:hypothetical protein BOX15_Mlig019246g1 [Macrostomum lignano]|uniref:LysM domain-containing protein n=2 Tax=Macrostomum lignano TaxID=282301 RepID=A0A1I8H3T2_9PLAT|nr:hypothetical protein BOX15_Mlig019246g1 [Macrostomum lignano]